MTRTGLERSHGSVPTRPYLPPDASERGPFDSDTLPHTAGQGPTLPSAVPSFLEACARLASEAAARRDFARARDLIEKAARVAALADATSRAG